MRTLLILIALTLTACTEFANEPPTPPVASTPPHETAAPAAVDDGTVDACGITLDRMYGCKAACDHGQLCAAGQSAACLAECVDGAAAGSWCPFPPAGL